MDIKNYESAFNPIFSLMEKSDDEEDSNELSDDEEDSSDLTRFELKDDLNYLPAKKLRKNCCFAYRFFGRVYYLKLNVE